MSESQGDVRLYETLDDDGVVSGAVTRMGNGRVRLSIFSGDSNEDETYLDLDPDVARQVQTSIMLAVTQLENGQADG